MTLKVSIQTVFNVVVVVGFISLVWWTYSVDEKVDVQTQGINRVANAVVGFHKEEIAKAKKTAKAEVVQDQDKTRQAKRK